MEHYSLRELCNVTGISRRAIQGYESYNLLKPVGKNHMGYLIYDEAAVSRAKEIKRLQGYGFTLKEIVTYQSTDNTLRKQILKDKLVTLESHYKKTEQSIAELRAMISDL